MIKITIIENIANELHITTRMSGHYVNTLLESIMNGVKENWEVVITWFWTFKKNKRNTRYTTNPQKPSEKLIVPEMNVVSFKSGDQFKKIMRE